MVVKQLAAEFTNTQSENAQLGNLASRLIIAYEPVWAIGHRSKIQRYKHYKTFMPLSAPP